MTYSFDNMGKSQYNRDSRKFLVKVTAIDQGEFIEDNGAEPKTYKDFGSAYNSRNIYISGMRLDLSGKPCFNIIVPQAVIGEFVVPQIGDIVWVEERGIGMGIHYFYIGAQYNEANEPDTFNHPVPYWGGLPGDYGYVMTHRHHSSQFAPNIKIITWEDVPKNEPNFITKYVSSIVGYRYRKYYKSNLADGRFAIRGDVVFDIDRTLINERQPLSTGAQILKGENIDDIKQHQYPNPLNAPIKRIEDPNFTYIYDEYKYIPDIPYEDDITDDTPINQLKKNQKTVVHKVANNFSYEPLSDKEYFQRNNNKFQREISSAVEHTIRVHGNTIHIMEHDVEGERVSIVIKNANDASIAILQNGDLSQVRYRDHLGQNVLIEGNAAKPRIIATTAERQVMEMGSFRDPDTFESKGSYLRLRNGPAYGDADTSFGRKTGKQLGNVFNQDVLMIDNKDLLEIEEFTQRLAPGFASIVEEAGLYWRTVDDSLSGKYNLYGKVWADKEGKKLYKKDYYYQQDVQATLQHEYIIDAESKSITDNTIRKINKASITISEQNQILSQGDITHTVQNKTPLGNVTLSALQQADVGNVTQTLEQKAPAGAASYEVTQDASAVNYKLTQKVSGALNAEMIFDPGQILFKKYASGVPKSSLSLTNGEAELKGEAVKINGSSVEIQGLTVSVIEGDGSY